MQPKTRTLKPYQPKPEDTAWWLNAINALKDGGTVGTSKGVYKIDKVNRKVTLVAPKLEESFETFCVHHRHYCVLAAIGWTLEPKVDWENLQIPNTPENSDHDAQESASDDQ